MSEEEPVRLAENGGSCFVSIHIDRLADDFLAFASLAPRAKTELTLQGELMKRLRPFGVTHVAAGVMADSRRNFKLGRAFGEMNLAWMRAYVDRRLYRHDPVIDHALRFERAAYWDKTFKPAALSRNAARVVSTAADLGAKDGFMTPLPLFNGDILIVSFQGERLDRDPNVEAMMRGLALYYGIEGQRLVARVLPAQAAGYAPTPRQLQVLHLAALGRRNREIGEELKISLNTVEFHLKCARRRMKVTNTKEAVALLHSTPSNFFPGAYRNR